ncbi:uncharacterized protein FFB20_07600 [Fusarium fujikuroi]|nr:uncharacterized protein FFB20_07600 [Fusarium fujikuroi]SCN89428.1 uncharacterized protein FFC1_05745 [Fusarium fujikuroi]SCN93740.1 uncharacterized protein FFE2_07838 [Fusarium fujikuroi]SCO41717.1 uncharacterized protein FFNC_08105 [Fusarium fujikuroi]SCV33057.1 uncharacterized protein FFFS_03597 [Fusarium fujikuroi]
MLHFGYRLFLLLALLPVPTWADSGDDFSNNLFSDLAPLLALFGERVTMQFLSQSMGWADCIILAVAPLGIITTIVSAIRVDGPAWLKAIIGRSRENLSAAEMELMSSTSQETCELWNERDVVRCQGKAPVTEFICLAPPKGDGVIKRIRFLTLSEAIDQKLVQKQCERKVNIFNVIALYKGSHTEPQPSEISSHSSEGGKRYLWDAFRSRRKSRDVEVPTPILLESRTSEAQAEPSLAYELIVLRNTTTHAPNISLNRYHKVGRGHLYMVAIFGILLQLGVLVYFGSITYYPTLKFKKDDKEVLGYGFPFAAGGTLVLILGMLLCAHVVDRSTTEERYEPAQGREMRMIWLQQKQIVSDQVFGSFALYPQRCPQVIVTSQRDSTTKSNRGRDPESSAVNNADSTSSQSEETENEISSSDSESGPAFNLTVIATAICLAGFIIQFIGLRAMHWSASVGQLIAVIIMTILRALVRVGFIAPIEYFKLRDKFELDGLALALGDPKLGPDSGPVDEEHRFDFGLSQGRTWKVVLKEDQVSQITDGSAVSLLSSNGDMGAPAQSNNPKPGGLSVERQDNEAQEILDIRKHLAHLAGWRGPASKEANSLAEAIEVTMNTLCPRETAEPRTWSWTIQIDVRAKDEDPKGFPISLHLSHQKGQWKARVDELDAVLSLWLASIDRERELASTTSKEEEIDDDDEWYRKRSSQTRGGLVLLGEHTESLKQAFEWWLPADAPKPLEIEESEIKEQYDETWRIVGTKFREGYYMPPLTESSEKEEEREQANSSDSDELDDEDDDDGDDDDDSSDEISAPSTLGRAIFFYIESNDTLEQLFARHIFHAFVWAAASQMKAPIDQHSEMEVVGTVIPGEWNNIRFRGTSLARLVGSIRSSGLMDLNQAFITLIPPLHAYARLGELDCVIEAVLGQALQHEKALNWEAAYESYIALLDLSSQFREDSFAFRRTVAIAVEYMRTLKLLPKVPESGEDQFYVTESIYESLSLRLNSRTYQQIRNDLGTLYERQRRAKGSPCNDGEQREIINCGFTRLHDMTAQNQFDHEFDKRERKRMRHRPLKPIETRVAIEDITDKLQKYVRAQDILGWTPLHYAAAWNDDEAPYWIDSLLARGADLDAPDIRGWTPLHYSLWNANHRAVRTLVEKGANTKIAGVDGITPLHCAAAKMTGRIINKLISHPRHRADQFATDNFGRMPIHLAAQEGNTRVIGTLLPSIHEKDQYGGTAFHLAAFSGKLKTLSKIIECGADANEPFGSYYDSTTLHWAAEHSKTGLAKILLHLGANVNARDCAKFTALHCACMHNRLEMVEILMGSGADVNAEDRCHHTPLWHAAYSGNTECVGRLLEAENFDINAPVQTGESPLYGAIKRGRGDIVRMLVEKGAKISQQMVDFAADLYEPGERKDKEDVEKMDEDKEEEEDENDKDHDDHDDDEDEEGDKEEDKEEEDEDEEEVHVEEGNKRLGLKTEDFGKYIRAAFSLQNAFCKHVQEDREKVILSELIRRLCPP